MRKKIYALVDCNNFYVSCERVFHASLRARPVIVLSNNDGCVVARSNEVKKLGIKMGQPIFECEELIRKHNIQIFSSNYSLYADMSARVTFLDLSEQIIDDLSEFGRTIKARVLQFTGIPVSVGIASTKCLTKVANEIVKNDARYEGVLDVTALSEQATDEMLAKVAIEDVWGIGSKYSLFLMNHGILSAKDLKYADEKWIRRYLTVVGERIVLELRGTACIPLEAERPAKKGIMCSKSFGRDVTRLEELEEIIATYTARAAEKLRSQDSLTSCITVFIRTNALKDTPQYSNSFSQRIPYPTAFTPELIRYALKGLRAMYRDGYNYKKAGVFLTKIIPQDGVQPDLFSEFSLYDYYKQARLMYLIDAINKMYGRDTLFFAVQGITRPWKMRQSRLSGHFTTRWSDILTIN